MADHTNAEPISQVKHGNEPKHVYLLNTANWFPASVSAEHPKAAQPSTPVVVMEKWAPLWQQTAAQLKQKSRWAKGFFWRSQTNVRQLLLML